MPLNFASVMKTEAGIDPSDSALESGKNESIKVSRISSLFWVKVPSPFLRWPSFFPSFRKITFVSLLMVSRLVASSVKDFQASLFAFLVAIVKSFLALLYVAQINSSPLCFIAFFSHLRASLLRSVSSSFHHGLVADLPALTFLHTFDSASFTSL